MNHGAPRDGHTAVPTEALLDECERTIVKLMAVLGGDVRHQIRVQRQIVVPTLTRIRAWQDEERQIRREVWRRAHRQEAPW